MRNIFKDLYNTYNTYSEKTYFWYVFENFMD